MKQPTDPKAWREAQGLTQAAVASLAGIGGRNPSRTYQRYEIGAQQAPAEVVASVEQQSRGTVTAASWHAVRLAWLSTVMRRA